MLSEPNMMIHINSHLLQEQKYPSQEVSKGFVIDQLLLDCFSELHPFWFLHVLLMCCTVEWQFKMGYVFEFRVGFVLRVHEVFDFGHLELSNSD